MTGSRTPILTRIREALRAPARSHGTGAEHTKPASGYREWLPRVGPEHADRVKAFAALSEVLKTEFLDLPDAAAATAHLSHLAEAHSWKRIAIHPGSIIDPIVGPLAIDRLSLTGSYDKHELEACDAGVTECECLVAQTGSVCVTSRSSGGRALSVLPPHHIVVARREQLVTDLTAAYTFLAEKYAVTGYPSFISFITGPSRTGDIERILVLGAHGPKKLTVLLVP